MEKVRKICLTVQDEEMAELYDEEDEDKNEDKKNKDE